ncbi:hypothetical protein [Chitinophaga sp. XS-30]|uniref:hypothetical protein n=1 Tax=Chitinophaga sp. XS-30 TaxID=2604421 RepID=UPI0011DCD85C|nr:hypothetical protein [Chitinophaga sp. XS-30]QEH39461.1 hypothetical protein FW415_00660 [Chitinophaga sp. XS-30]
MKVLLLFSILLFGCRKNDRIHSPQADAPVSIKPVWQIMEKLDPDIQEIIKRMEETPDLKAACLSHLRPLGMSYWGKALTGNHGQTDVFIVPIKRGEDSLFHAFMAVESDTSVRIQFYSWSQLNDWTPPSVSSLPGATDINHLFNALNHFGFGKRPYQANRLSAGQQAAIMENAFPLHSMREQIQPQGVIIVPRCYSWSACIGDGNGNCITPEYFFTECIDEIIWITDAIPVYPGGSDGSNPRGGGTTGSGGGGGSGDGIIKPVNRPTETLLAPKKPIDDIEAYLKCFVTQVNATVTVQVDQPTAGTTDPVSIFGGIGHVFLTIEQTVNGHTTRRTIGFYPHTKIDPLRRKTAPGVLGDDGGRGFNIKWSAEISGSQLQNMLNFAVQAPGDYHIDAYNCANYVLDMLDAAGVHLPRTKGWWLSGSGLNPGNLGEDLRQLPGSVSGRGFGEANAGECN